MTMVHNEVDPDSENERRRRVHRDYVASLVGARLANFREAYGTSDMSESHEERHLRRAAAQALGILDVAATLGRQIVYAREGQEQTRHDPIVKLGWLTIDLLPNPTQVPGERSRYVVHPTDEGMMVLNEMRTMLGEPSAEEALARNLTSYREQAERIKGSSGSTSGK